MIASQAKDFTEAIIKKYAGRSGSKAVKIVRSKIEEERYRTDKNFPFISLLTANGCVDERMTTNETQWTEKIPQSMFQGEFHEIIKKLNDEKKEIVADSYRFDEETKTYQLLELSKEEEELLDSVMESIGYNKRYKAYIRGAVKQPVEIRVFASNEEESNRILLDIVRNIPEKWTLNHYEGKILIGETTESDWSTDLRDCILTSCLVAFYMDIGTDKEELPVIKNFEFGDEYGHLE